MMSRNTCHSAKSEQIAEALRKEGNEFYSQRKFLDALVKYNASLCFSPIESENLGHTYANRSAVCFEIKKYKECIENINLAKIHNYPKENFKSLNLRDTKCNELLKKWKEPNSKWNFFKLSFEANKNHPQLTNILELKNDEKYGRYIVTNRDILAGSILAIEKPFISVLLSYSKRVEVDANNKYKRCSYCLKDNILKLLPCSGCNCAMFCEECFKEAFKIFHKYECGVMEKLLSSGSVHIALRIFFVALSTFDGSIEKLEKFMKLIDGEDKFFSIFNFTSSKKEIKNYLKFLNTLTRSDTKFSTEAHEEILKNHPDISQIYEANQDFIKKFLQRQCQTNDHYFHGVFGARVGEISLNTLKDLHEPIGSAWYPFHSLINHSCSSNVMRIYVDGKVVLIASRFIPNGSQLFDSYNVSFTKHSKSERQSRLLREFGFRCDCEACTNNYSTPPPMKDIKLAKLAVKMEKEILEKKSIKLFKECCKLINENCEKFPSLELVSLQKCFAHFLLVQAK